MNYVELDELDQLDDWDFLDDLLINIQDEHSRLTFKMSLQYEHSRWTFLD